MNTRAGLDGVEVSPLAGFDPRIVQPVPTMSSRSICNVQDIDNSLKVGSDDLLILKLRKDIKVSFLNTLQNGGKNKC